MKVVLPLSPSDMVKFFESRSAGEELVLLIDYEQSKKNMVTDLSILMYIGNLGITCNLDHISVEFVKEYLKCRELVNIINVQFLVEALLLSIAFDDDDQIENIDDELMDMLNELTMLVLELPNAIDVWKDYKGDEDGTVETRYGNMIDIAQSKDYQLVDDDSLMVGVNWINTLLSDVPMLLIGTYNTEDHNILHKPQYFEYIYRGKNLFSMLLDKNAPVMGLAFALAGE